MFSILFLSGPLTELEEYFEPDPFVGASTDLRAVADIWLNLFRPYQDEILKTRQDKDKLLQLKNLKKILLEAHIASGKFKAFKNELLAPESERIVVAIIGVAEDKTK